MTLAYAAAAVLAVLVWPERTSLPNLTAPLESRAAEGDRASSSVSDVADALSLLALGLRAGTGPLEALDAVAERNRGAVREHLRRAAAAHRWGVSPDRVWDDVPEVWRPAALAWQIALAAGAPPAELVENAARQIRDAEARRVEAATARAGALLVLPLGLAFLPGFACTTVIPVVLELASSVFAS